MLVAADYSKLLNRFLLFSHRLQVFWAVILGSCNSLFKFVCYPSLLYRSVVIWWCFRYKDCRNATIQATSIPFFSIFVKFYWSLEQTFVIFSKIRKKCSRKSANDYPILMNSNNESKIFRVLLRCEMIGQSELVAFLESVDVKISVDSYIDHKLS